MTDEAPVGSFAVPISSHNGGHAAVKQPETRTDQYPSGSCILTLRYFTSSYNFTFYLTSPRPASHSAHSSQCATQLLQHQHRGAPAYTPAINHKPPTTMATTPQLARANSVDSQGNERKARDESAATPPPAQPESMTLTMRNQANFEVAVKLKPTTKLKKAMVRVAPKPA